VREPEPAVEVPAAALQSPVTAAPGILSPQVSVGKKRIPGIGQIARSFGFLLLLDYVVGRTEYTSLGQPAMWVNLMTLASVVAGILVYLNLRQARIGTAGSVLFTAILVSSWVGMTIIGDAMIGMVIDPLTTGHSLNLGFFKQQSPWIWIYLGVLPLSGFGGCLAYRMSLKE